MKTLISKLQLDYYETGEFSHIEERTLQETLAMLHNFQWRKQDGFNVVRLSGPSIAIENGGSYLKIGLYYYGKFSIYFLDEHNKLFLKIIDTLTEAEVYIAAFFEGTIRQLEFKKYFEFVFKKKKHFVTGHFAYRTTRKRMISIMIVPIIMAVCCSLVLLLLYSDGHGLRGFVLLAGFYLLVYGVNLLLFFNYYSFSRKQILILSRGHDEFYFGRYGQTEKYFKHEIKAVCTFSNERWSKCPWADFCRYEIHFNNGTVIKFTNFLIGSFKFDEKFPDHTVRAKHQAIPWIK